MDLNVELFLEFVFYNTIDHYDLWKTMDFYAKFVFFREKLRLLHDQNNIVVKGAELIFASFGLHFVFLLVYEHDQIQTIALMDMVEYCGFDRSINLGFLAFMYVIWSIYHNVFIDINLFIIDNFKAILFNKPQVLFHYPYMYKDQQSVFYVRKRMIYFLRFANLALAFEGRCVLSF